MDLWEPAVMGAIDSRLDNRRWYRAHRWSGFADLERENTIALRELVRVACWVRRQERRRAARRAIPAGEAPGVYTEAFGR